jgi:integrase
VDFCCQTIYAWAAGKKLARNPFAEVKITVPRKVRTRESKAFTDEEIRTVLTAALAADSPARRWLPWLAAYTGARMGELTQLRGKDVTDGALKLTPEAGTMKSRKPRSVPLHEHLIEQGFLAFVKASGDGPLFAGDPRRVRDKLGVWVRSLGVSDPEVLPNHAWRHTFKAVAHRAGLSEKVIDAIVGHAPASVGRAYGEPTLQDKADALAKFPRYAV